MSEFLTQNWLSLITLFGSIMIGWGYYKAKFKNLEKRVEHLENDTTKELQHMNETLVEIKTKLDLLFEGKININRHE